MPESLWALALGQSRWHAQPTAMAMSRFGHGRSMLTGMPRCIHGLIMVRIRSRITGARIRAVIGLVGAGTEEHGAATAGVASLERFNLNENTHGESRPIDSPDFGFNTAASTSQ